MTSAKWFLCEHALPPAPGGKPTAIFYAAHLVREGGEIRCGEKGATPVESGILRGFISTCARCLELSELIE